MHNAANVICDQPTEMQSYNLCMTATTPFISYT